MDKEGVFRFFRLLDRVWTSLLPNLLLLLLLLRRLLILNERESRLLLDKTWANLFMLLIIIFLKVLLAGETLLHDNLRFLLLEAVLGLLKLLLLRIVSSQSLLSDEVALSKMLLERNVREEPFALGALCQVGEDLILSRWLAAI